MVNILWGIVFIIIGVIWSLNALDITNINIFFDGWWTLLIIVPCFIDLFKEHDKTGNIIGIIIGIILLFACQDIIDFEIVWKLCVPIILILIGISMVFKNALNKKETAQISPNPKNQEQEYYATFSGQNIDFANEALEGCNVNAIFGGIKCDTTKAKIKKDVVINTCAIFGGITIYVPENVNVKISSTPIFGGVKDNRKDKSKENEITIYINATCMFGGIEIK